MDGADLRGRGSGGERGPQPTRPTAHLLPVSRTTRRTGLDRDSRPVPSGGGISGEWVQRSSGQSLFRSYDLWSRNEDRGRLWWESRVVLCLGAVFVPYSDENREVHLWGLRSRVSRVTGTPVSLLGRVLLLSPSKSPGLRKWWVPKLFLVRF